MRTLTNSEDRDEMPHYATVRTFYVHSVSGARHKWSQPMCPGTELNPREACGVLKRSKRMIDDELQIKLFL